MQLNHYNSKFQARKFPICIICEGLSSPYNIGGVFRIADAFGVEKVFLINNEQSLGSKYKKTSRAAENYVDFEILKNFNDVYSNLSSANYQFVALEITSSSISIQDLEIDPQIPVALIIGSENSGISEAILKRVSNHTHIDMYGVNSSMNVVQSAAIALYELVKRFK